MKKAKNIPDQEQRIKFQGYLQEWQVLLGLMDWRIVLIDKLAPGAMACVTFNEDARMAVLKLGDFGAHKIDDESLRATACHELLHVLLHDLTLDNENKELGMLEHRVINVFEKLLTGTDNG